MEVGGISIVANSDLKDGVAESKRVGSGIFKAESNLERRSRI